MLQILYILAFTVIAVIAISNLVKSLFTLGMDSQKLHPPKNTASSHGSNTRGQGRVLHPELLDDKGKPINEPLLVMRSISVEDAREKLDALYNASPSNSPESEDQA